MGLKWKFKGFRKIVWLPNFSSLQFVPFSFLVTFLNGYIIVLLWRRETCQTWCVMSTTMSQHIFCDLFESICIPSTHVDASDQQNFAELSFALIDYLPLSNSPMIKSFAICFVSWRSRNFLNYQKVVLHLVIEGNWQSRFVLC